MKLRSKARLPEAPGPPDGGAGAGGHLDLDAFLDILARPEPVDPRATFLIGTAGGGLPLPAQILDVPPAGTAGAPVVFVFHGALDQSRREHPGLRRAVPDPQGRPLRHGDRPGRSRSRDRSRAQARLVRRLRGHRYARRHRGARRRRRGAAEPLPGDLHRRLGRGPCRAAPGPRPARQRRGAGQPPHAHPPEPLLAGLRPALLAGRPARGPPDLRRGASPTSPISPPTPTSGSTIVYLLNALDDDLAPARRRVPRRARPLDDVLLQVEHWPGFTGHSYPQPAWADWVRIAAEAPGVSVADLAAQKTAGRRRTPDAAARRRRGTAPGAGRLRRRRHRAGRPAGRHRKVRAMAEHPAAHPYADLPPQAFWKTAVATRHYADLEDLSGPIRLAPSDRVATAGSCFAQHIGANLAARGARYMDVEPAPAGWASEDARRHGFGLFSARYGNIYTSRQLLQLAQEALGRRVPQDRVWEKGGRFFDALRPRSIRPAMPPRRRCWGCGRAHLAAVRKLLGEIDVLVFTLGLTETWEAVGRRHRLSGGARHARRRVRPRAPPLPQPALPRDPRRHGGIPRAPARDQPGRADDPDRLAGAADRHRLGRPCAGGLELFQVDPARRGRRSGRGATPMSPISRPTRSSPATRGGRCSSTPTCAASMPPGSIT